ncbi:GNAT family N-acetyltransferase [Hyphomicrobium sp.]|uniref:GNAT family N-acetyltransferase n=1 Tax=Hyphomicrobium sp. TaxID=82 RepID=UPI002FE3DD64
MNAVTVRKEETAHGGRYVATVAGKPGEAELTFAVRGAGRISADHTGAPGTLRGTGAALALVEHMVEDARRSGFKIVPVCSYVEAQFDRHPEWHDVRADDA